MERKFWKYDPSGNTTVLLDNRDGGLDRRDYARTAAEVMAPQSVCAEQAGYWEPPTRPGALGRLHMMGGEFCGNAARCCAKLLWDQGVPGILRDGRTGAHVVPVEVSGAEGVLRVRLEPGEESLVYGGMPLPAAVQRVRLSSLEGEADQVEFDGIRHLVLWDVPFERRLAEKVVREVYDGEAPPEALGVMFYAPGSGELVPAVYVRAMDTLVLEGSCGSGSVATAASILLRTGRPVVRAGLRQPGGVILVSYDGSSAEIGGPVLLRTEGRVLLGPGTPGEP